jgi:hypothetical protein
MGTDSIIFSCQIYSFKNNLKNEKYKKREFCGKVGGSYSSIVDSFGFGVFATKIRNGLSDLLYQQWTTLAGL